LTSIFDQYICAQILARSPRLVVVCPDERRETLAAACGGSLVFGIREAKGLEFREVARTCAIFHPSPHPTTTVWGLSS
jgi:hypothetical protein